MNRHPAPVLRGALYLSPLAAALWAAILWSL